MQHKTEHYQFVVVGGGMSGVCAAIAAARHGARTVLVQNRPVLGGNASSEIRMHICGADNHAKRENARETGIVEEILLENKRRNTTHSFAIFDSVLWEKCAFQENLTLYLNTHMTSAAVENGKIVSIEAVQLTSETTYTFIGDIFLDATGDATLGALCGADAMYGREDKAAFGEPHGQDAPDRFTMGNSLMFEAQDMGEPVPFVKPDWANTYTEADLKFRGHDDVSSGYWWIELGGGEQSTIDDAEPLRDELLKVVYGVWDHIKNGGDHGADNYQLQWVGMLPGKRESRRLTGDYVLNENDLMENRHFDDAIAFGGWPMDCHVIEGFRSHSEEPTVYLHMPDVYAIPYRCLYSKNIQNLMLGGRAVSASHLAFASTRVMGTCAVMGQAAGTAAAMAIGAGEMPKSICARMPLLQQTLLRDDCYIPGVVNEDAADKARTAAVTATSERDGYPASNVINGVSRTVHENANLYVSDGIREAGETVSLKLKDVGAVSSVELKFDSDLSHEIMISLSRWVRSHQQRSTPAQLVRDFDVVARMQGVEVARKAVRGNAQRLIRVAFDAPVQCDEICVTCYATNGDKDIRIYEIRVY